jgi:hypothetical protein
VGSGHESRLRAKARRHGHESRSCFNQVGYFLSPLDLLKECLTFFRFKAAFKRLVFFRLFISTSMIVKNDGIMGEWNDGW